MDAITAPQSRFLAKYLGVTAGRTDAPDGAEFRKSWSRACDTWRQQVERVDGQVSRLQQVLRSSDDPELVGIATFGLNAITGNHRVRVMAAIREIETGPKIPPANAVSNARKRLADFAAHLASDPRIKACDTNPVGVDMNIARSLGTAVADLQAALKSVPG